MATAKEKRLRERLLEIRRIASEANAAQQTKGGITGHDLAEEAAGLGIELADLLTSKED